MEFELDFEGGVGIRQAECGRCAFLSEGTAQGERGGVEVGNTWGGRSPRDTRGPRTRGGGSMNRRQGDDV